MEVALRVINLLMARLKGFSYNLPQLKVDSLKCLLWSASAARRLHQSQSRIFYCYQQSLPSDVTGFALARNRPAGLLRRGKAGATGLRQMLREMDKQVLPDGVDFESSTGYHRFVLELFFYSFCCAALMMSRSRRSIGPNFTGCDLRPFLSAT